MSIASSSAKSRFVAMLGAASLITIGGTARAEFVTGVSSFSQGKAAFASGSPGPQYADPNAALSRPSPETSAGPVEAFNPPFEAKEIVAIGLGGQLTLSLATPVSVNGQTQVGIFTSTGLDYGDDPNFTGVGRATTPAETFAYDEFQGAERTAVVEVASSLNDFRSLGRVTFNIPTQGYSNQTLAFQTPDNPALSNFDQPFHQDLSKFSGLTEVGVEDLLAGSAGGTWLDVSGTGLTDIQYIRISQTQWMLPNGQLVDERASRYYGDDDPFVKPADLFVDGVNVVPEPSAIALILIAATGLRRTPRRNGRSA